MSNLKQTIKSILGIQTYRHKRFYRQLIKKGDLCFDIGANLGKKSKLFLSLGGKVIAFEPQSNCHLELQKIKHPNFSYFPDAVGASDGEKELQLANHVEVATFSQAFIDYFENDELQWKHSEKVTLKKLDTLIKAHGLPDFCKIDVEGYEFEILSHLTHEIPCIEFEFTGGFIPETVQSINLLNKGNTLFNYILNERPYFELKKWVCAHEMINILKNMPVKRLHGNIFVKNVPQ